MGAWRGSDAVQPRRTADGPQETAPRGRAGTDRPAAAALQRLHRPTRPGAAAAISCAAFAVPAVRLAPARHPHAATDSALSHPHPPQRPRHRTHRLYRRLAATLLLLTSAMAAQADTPPGCDVFWLLTPNWSDTGTRLQVRTATPAGDAGTREWQPTPDDPALMTGARHLLALGQALLPLPPALTTRPHLQMCLRVDGLDDTQVLASNLHAEAAGPDRLLRWQGSPALLRELVVAAGSLQQRERQAGPLRLRLLLAPELADRADALADEAAATLAAHRRFWRSNDAVQAVLLLHADDRGAAPATLARGPALVLRAPSAALAPGAAFKMQLARADLRGWFRNRFGPTVYEHQPDDAANAWFVEGFSLFYALRLAAADDGWPVQDFAGALTALWQQDAAGASAFWLPLRWHTTLREHGGAEGLDGVLRRLTVPAAQAKTVGRLSSPLAGHRLFAALRPTLGDEPRRDVQQLAQAAGAGSLRGELKADAFGPCFTLITNERRVQATAETAACRAWLAGTGTGAGSGPTAEAAQASGEPTRQAARTAKGSAKGSAQTPAKGSAKNASPRSAGKAAVRKTSRRSGGRH